MLENQETQHNFWTHFLYNYYNNFGHPTRMKKICIVLENLINFFNILTVLHKFRLQKPVMKEVELAKQNCLITGF